MPNCLANIGRMIDQATVKLQVAEHAGNLEGKHVLRLGKTMAVEAVDLKKRTITIVSDQGKQEAVRFDDFFKEYIKVITPVHLLEPVNIDLIDSSWVGKYLYHDGDRWKVLKVSKTPRMGLPLLTLESDGGDVQVYAAQALKDWQVKRLAKPNVSQRISKKYKRP